MGYYVEDEGGDRIKLDASNLDEAISEAERLAYEDLGVQTVDIYRDGEDEPLRTRRTRATVGHLSARWPVCAGCVTVGSWSA